MSIESSLPQSFDERLAASCQRFQFSGTEYKGFDLGENENDPPTLFVPGWNTSVADYKEVLQALLGRDRRVFSLEFGNVDEEEKAGELIDFLEGKGAKGIDAIAYSVGAISVVIAAEKIPSLLKRIVLLNPPSMMREESEAGLVRRYINYLRKMGGELGNVNVGIDAFKKMAKVIRNFDMYGKLRELQELGVNITSFHAEDDDLFPADLVRKEAARQNALENMRFVAGGHSGVNELMPAVIQVLA